MLGPSYDFGNGFFVTVPVTPPKTNGIDHDPPHYDYPPIPWEAIAKECKFIQNALITGGKDYSEPMWNLTTLAAVFLEDSHGLAHAMGNKHPGYTIESTTEKWQRKVKEKEENGVGWPSCQAIQAAGCTDCATCPHLVKGKSPLNLASLGALIVLQELPYGYEYSNDGIICKRVKSKKDKGETLTPLFYSRLTEPWTQKNPAALNFTTTTDRSHSQSVCLKAIDIVGTTEVCKALVGQGVKPILENRRHLEGFFMAWYNLLEQAKEAIKTHPYGWHFEEDGTCTGFVYGGSMFKNDGSRTPAAIGHSNLRNIYSPTGQLDPWYEACKLITDQENPGLSIIVLASFAAPLMRDVGQSGALISAYSASGFGKSSAMDIGNAVWGHPKKAKEVTLSTARSIIAKLGELRNLPVYWDEVKDEEAQRKAYDTLYMNTDGTSHGKMNRHGEYEEKADWQTMMVVCSNRSFVDYVIGRQRTTDAGVLRVFEYEVPESTKGRLNKFDFSHAIDKLRYHYGKMGLLVAEHLGSNPAKWRVVIDDTFKRFEKYVKDDGLAPRFWVSVCVTLIVGAQIANELGCQFDVSGLWDFLAETYAANSKRLINEAMRGGSRENTTSQLSQFLNTHQRNSVWTDSQPGKGRNKVTMLNQLLIGTAVFIHWIVQDKLLRLHKGEFIKFVSEQGGSPQTVISGLEKEYGAIIKQARMASGTAFVCTSDRVIEIEINEGSELYEQLTAHNHALAVP